MPRARRPRGPTSCGPSRSRATTCRHPEGSVLVEFGDTKVHLHGLGRGQGAAVPEGPRRRAGSRRSTGCCRARPTRATCRETRGPSGRSQEIQRLVGRSLRAVIETPQARRAHDLGRLRRHPGRRRHPHGRHHRRLRRLADAVGNAAEAGSAAGRRPARLRGRHQRGHRRPVEPLLDLELRRGLDGRGRHERRHDRRAASSSRCRAPPSRCRSAARVWTSCWRWPSAASASWSRCSAAPSTARAENSLHACRCRASSSPRSIAPRAASCATLLGDVRYEVVAARRHARRRRCPRGTGVTYAENALVKARAVGRRDRRRGARRRLGHRGRRARRRSRRALRPLRRRGPRRRRPATLCCSSGCAACPPRGAPRVIAA